MSELPPKLVRIFISSPSDVAEERKAAAELIEQELAKREAFRKPLKLDVFRYDDPYSDTPFLSNRSAQAPVDRRGQPADGEIIIAILWARMGTPVRDPANPDKILYQSGTEQEVEEALKAGRQVLVYFRRGQHPLPDNDDDVVEALEQRRKVRAFRVLLDQQGRGVNEYQDVADFRRKLEQHLDQLLTRIRDASLAPARRETPAPDPRWTGDPYPGLRSFEPEEAPIFFGRKDETAELVRWVGEEGRRFVAVIGVLGSGKSSLVKAGLVPALREWPTAIVRLTDAGGDPLRALAIRLDPLLPPSRRLALRADPATRLAELGWIDELLDEKPASASLLIVIDEFEELQTAVADPLRVRFVALLKALTEHDRVRIVVSLRADFLGALSRDETLARLLGGDSFILYPPGAAALRAIIREPARLVGVAVDDSLIHELAEAARSEPGALPLLAFALERLYRQRDGQRLARRAIGGSSTLGGILINYTEEVEDALPLEQREALPRLFLHLVRVEDGERHVAKRRCRPTDIGADDVTLIAVRDRLIEARLLTPLSDPVEGVELAHEVLLHAWPSLQTWVTSYGAYLVVRDDVERLRAAGAPRLEGWLLERAVDLVDKAPELLDETQTIFVRRSRKEYEELQHNLGSARKHRDRSRNAGPGAAELPTESKWYVSYAWADDRTPEGRAREAIVDRLCKKAEDRGHTILRDKEVLRLGQSISRFMRRIGSGDRIFIILSDKYLRSSHCMSELIEVWRMSRQEEDDFLERVRIYALPDVNISAPADWARLAIYWKQQHDSLDKLARDNGPWVLGKQGYNKLQEMHDIYTQVSDILGTLADIVQPRTFQELELYGFDDLPP
jgi:internalin A